MRILAFLLMFICPNLFPSAASDVGKLWPLSGRGGKVEVCNRKLPMASREDRKVACVCVCVSIL